MTQRICTFLTDFGLMDPYVASMKGVLLAGAPGTQIVDLSHEIPPQDIRRASLFLSDALSYFPEGTVHVVVIDPGVGTSRRVCVARGGGQTVVFPDNGLITDWWRSLEGAECVHVTRSDLIPDNPSETFHGRDIFTPIAAALLTDAISFEECGEPVGPILLHDPGFKYHDGVYRGSVLYADRFGNLITTIPGSSVSADVAFFSIPDIGRVVRVRTYGEARPGELVVLTGSTGLLELAVVNGSAAGKLELEAGSSLELRVG